jgi:hypothetical protein
MITPDETPPFAAPFTCPACDQPYSTHPSNAALCRDKHNLLTVLKATAINTHEIHQMLVKVIAAFEKTPQSPNNEKPQGFSLPEN